MEKAALRKQMIEQRLALSPDERQARSCAAQAALLASEAFASARRLLLYVAFRGEVGTEAIVAAAAKAGKELVLPRVEKATHKLWLHRWDGDWFGLHNGTYGIQEPCAVWPLVEPGSIDLVVVPGAAFDRLGGRLGYGGGYYDRLLPLIRTGNSRAKLIGLAYDLQVVEAIPTEEHDVRLDGVATEAGLCMARE
ncbi:MAG: 5-formyltetrahydrofolate cyclo-ligase [Mycobacterium leprae]